VSKPSKAPSVFFKLLIGYLFRDVVFMLTCVNGFESVFPFLIIFVVLRGFKFVSSFAFNLSWLSDLGRLFVVNSSWPLGLSLHVALCLLDPVGLSSSVFAFVASF
jgi:hypothetical protein